MKRYIWRVGGVLVVLAVIVALIPVFLPPGSDMESNDLSDAAAKTPGLIFLAQPAFAAEGQLEGANFLEQEAGISAFTNVGREISLGRARGAFRTIERETDEYIIGSVGVPGHDEEWDAHVFVHRDGWIVAFYGRGWPVSRIINLADLGTTRLETVLMQVTTAAGVSIRDVSYYNFRDPGADRLMIVSDRDSLNLKIPGAFTVFERSFATGNRFYINEERVWPERRGYRMIAPASLRPDIFHSVRAAAGVFAIVLVYSEE